MPPRRSKELPQQKITANHNMGPVGPRGPESPYPVTAVPQSGSENVVNKQGVRGKVPAGEANYIAPKTGKNAGSGNQPYRRDR